MFLSIHCSARVRSQLLDAAVHGCRKAVKDKCKPNWSFPGGNQLSLPEFPAKEGWPWVDRAVKGMGVQVLATAHPLPGSVLM